MLPPVCLCGTKISFCKCIKLRVVLFLKTLLSTLDQFATIRLGPYYVLVDGTLPLHLFAAFVQGLT